MSPLPQSKLTYRLALDPTDAVVGMPEIKGWSKELENRLTRGDFKGNKKEREKQYVIAYCLG